MGDKEDIVQIEKSLIELSAVVGTLVSSMAKLESAVTVLTDAMAVMARGQVTIEHHTEKIDANTQDIKDLQHGLTDLNNEVHGKCDITKTHIGTEDAKLYKRIEDTAQLLESNGWKRLFYAVGILTFAFGYLYMDMAKIDNDVSTKLDKILAVVQTTKTNQAVIEQRLSALEKAK